MSNNITALFWNKVEEEEKCRHAWHLIIFTPSQIRKPHEGISLISMDYIYIV